MDESRTETDAVLAAFAAYCDALGAKDSRRALELVDRGTIAAYQGFVDRARTLDRAGLACLDYIGRSMVLLVRHEFDAHTLARLTGESLIVAAVERGWINAESVRNIEVWGAEVDGDYAGISVVQMPREPVFLFVKEPDGWKYALWKSFDAGEEGFERMFAASGEDDPLAWLVKIVEGMSGREFDRALLDGPPR